MNWWEIVCSIVGFCANIAAIYGVIRGSKFITKWLQDREKRMELLKQIKDFKLVDVNDNYSLSKWNCLVRDLLILNPEQQNPFEPPSARPPLEDGKFYEEDLKYFFFNMNKNMLFYEAYKANNKEINKTKKENK
jgi:hypothetical protein